jgi:hypothetical protein
MAVVATQLRAKDKAIDVEHWATSLLQEQLHAPLPRPTHCVPASTSRTVGWIPRCAHASCYGSEGDLVCAAKF